MRNLEEAWKFAKVQGNIVTMLTNALDPELIKTWTTMMDAYYLSSSNPNPFEDPAPSMFFHLSLIPCTERKQGVTFADLKAELSRADSRSGTLHIHEITPSQFLLQALDIEDQQYVGGIYLRTILNSL